MNTTNRMAAPAAWMVALALAASPAWADSTFNLDVTGIPSWGLRGDVHNTVIWLDVGANALVRSIQWDVHITSNVGNEPWPETTYSWMDELGMAFTNSSQTAGFALRPGWQTDGPGSTTFADGGLLADISPREALPDGPRGFIEPVANFYDDQPDFRVGADGRLRLEFYEFREKNFPADAPDGLWDSGLVSFGVAAVPEPETYVLMGAGLLALGFLRLRDRRAER